MQWQQVIDYYQFSPPYKTRFPEGEMPPIPPIPVPAESRPLVSRGGPP